MDSRLGAGTDAKNTHAHPHLAVDAHAESGEALRVVAISGDGRRERDGQAEDLFISLIITADTSLSLIGAHVIAEHDRLELLEHLAGAAIVDVHVDPAGARDETHGHAVIHRADAAAGHQLGTLTSQEGSPDHA